MPYGHPNFPSPLRPHTVGGETVTLVDLLARVASSVGPAYRVDTGGNCDAIRVELDDDTYLLITTAYDAMVPSSYLDGLAVGRYDDYSSGPITSHNAEYATRRNLARLIAAIAGDRTGYDIPARY